MLAERLQKQHFNGAVMMLAFIDASNVSASNVSGSYDISLPIVGSNNVTLSSRNGTKNSVEG